MSSAPTPRRLAAVPAGATPAEVAAITAALAVIDAEERARTAPPGGDAERVDAWVRAARLSGRGTGFTRGPWRLGGRLTRRFRA